MLKIANLLITISFCFGTQSPIYSQSLASNKDYFKFINKGNEFIFEHKFEKAAIEYEQAFKIFKNPYFIDRINYLLVNLELKNQAKIESNLWILFEKKGIDTSLLFLNIDKKNFNQETLEFIRKNFKVASLQFKPDTVYKNELLQLLSLDQWAYGNNDNLADSMFITNKKQTNSLILKRLIHIIQKKGLPTEEKCGYALNNDMNIWLILNLFLRHSIQDGSIDTIIPLLTIMKNGNCIHPAIIANAYQLIWESGRKEPQFLYIPYYIVSVGARFYRPLIDVDEIIVKQINNNRINLGLDSLQNSTKYNSCAFFCFTGTYDKKFSLTPYTTYECYPAMMFDDKGLAKISSKQINIPELESKCNCKTK